MDPTTTTDDAKLLRRYAEACDEAAFAELVRRYVGLVYHASLRQMGYETHAAEDVTQRVFTLLARKAPTLQDHTTLAGWLHTTTRFTAREVMRAERRRRAREQEAFIMNGNPLVGSGAPSDAAWTDLRPVIDEALGELDASDREVVLLRYFADLPHAQIGARLRISENAARMRVERALEKLHARLARRGVTSTASALGVVLANQAGAASLALPAGMAASVTSAALAGASATGASVSAVGVFGFMSTAKIAAGLAAVVGVAGLGSAFYEGKNANQTEATLTALRREAEELRGHAAQNETLAREANERAKASEARVVALEKEIAAKRTTTSAGNVAPSTAARPATSVMGAQLAMYGNPEFFRLSGQNYRADLGDKFWLLYKTLNLSPEQIAKFEANRAESNMALLEIASSAEARGLTTSDPSVSKLYAEVAGPFEAELKSLLGDEGYRQYTEHSRAGRGLGLLKELAGAVYRSDAPLTASQSEQLGQAIMRETQMVPKTPGSNIRVNSTDWDGVALQARTVLAPTQFAAFQALLEKQKRQQRLTELRGATP